MGAGDRAHQAAGVDDGQAPDLALDEHDGGFGHVIVGVHDQRVGDDQRQNGPVGQLAGRAHEQLVAVVESAAGGEDLIEVGQGVAQDVALGQHTHERALVVDDHEVAYARRGNGLGRPAQVVVGRDASHRRVHDVSDSDVGDAGLHLPVGQELVQRRVEVLLGRVPGLGHVAIEPDVVDGDDGGLDIGMGREQGPAGLGVECPGLDEQRCAGHVRHPLGGDQQRHRFATVTGACAGCEGRRCGGDRHHRVIAGVASPHVALHRLQHGGVVVDDQDDRGAHRRRGQATMATQPMEMRNPPGRGDCQVIRAGGSVGKNSA